MRKKIIVAAVIVVVALGAGVAGAQVQQRFGDVPTDHYAYEAVDWAVDIGVTVGCGDGTNFCPERNLNRAHMVTFLKRYHDWLTAGPVPPPVYSSYEDASAAANAWYEQIVETIRGGTHVAHWQDVPQRVADQAALWGGDNPQLDLIINEALLLNRSGDQRILSRLGDVGEKRFYTAALGYALAAGASAVAQNSTSEREAASAAAWSAAGARVAEAAQEWAWFYCGDCFIAGHNRFNSSLGYFDWVGPAQTSAIEAQNAYIRLAS